MSVMTLKCLLGRTILSIGQVDSKDELLFELDNGVTVKFYHYQSCCEDVRIESIDGDVNDLIGAPLWQAEEVTESGDNDPDADESSTWTFYKFATCKGSVTVRWYGSSNGYYSESVDVALLRNGKEIKGDVYL